MANLFERFNTGTLPFSGRVEPHIKGIRAFPESATPDQSAQTYSGPDGPTINEHNAILNEIDHIVMIPPGEDNAMFPGLHTFCKSSLQSWIKSCRDGNIAVDIGRVTRFAVFEGHQDVVEYLVDNEHAALGQTDKFGRSVVSYASYCHDSAMLEYVVRKLGLHKFRSEVRRRDEHNKTPLHYATMRPSLSNVAFCLAAGARPDEDLVASLSDPLGNQSYGRIIDQFRLLFTLYTRLESYQDFPVHVMSSEYQHDKCDKYSRRKTRLSTIKELPLNPDLFFEVKNTEGQKPPGRCMNWIHIPWTNGLMLFMALTVINKRIRNRERSSDRRGFFLHCFRDPPTIPGDLFLNFREPTYVPGIGESLHNAQSVAIVFPCLILRDIKDFKSFRRFLRGLRNPVDEPSLRTIQVERTLDEAYYPSLDKKTIKIRSKNQVVPKAYTNSLKEEDASKKPRPILLVPQLWVWRFEDQLISAYSASGENLQTMKEELQDFSRTTFNGSSHPNLHIGLLLADHIDNFGRTQADDKFQSPLDLYEIGVVHVLSCMNEYVISSKSGTPKIEEEWELMKNISDIRSELAMIDSILNQQKQILNSLINYTNPDAKRDPDWWKVTSADQRLEGFLKRVTKIDRDAQQTEKDIQDRLNLVRAHASRRDARSSLALSTAVFGFTIVTIIFAPLNFTNGLLGLKSESFINHTIQVNGTQAFKAPYITKWFIAVEFVSLFVFTVMALVCLWSLGFFHETGDGPGKAESMNSERWAEENDDDDNDDDGKDTGPNLSSVSSQTVRRLWRRPKKRENVEA